jgi:hypothetical protein
MPKIQIVITAFSQLASIALPKDVWGVVLNHLHIYDIIFLRATNVSLHKFCKEFRLFPKYFILDQDKCMEYLVENGFESCLDYVKNVLRFRWTQNLCSVAARFGRVSTLEHLTNRGLVLDTNTLLSECTTGTCYLPMIKYLRLRGAPWDRLEGANDPTYETVMENMARHGHLECIKYALQDGCTQRRISYTPTIECLEFFIQNGFDWQGGQGTREIQGVPRFVKRSICEEAARLGNLPLLKYAHQHGARLNNSASNASREGHLDCLIYALDNDVAVPMSQRGIQPARAKTLECLKYALQKIGFAEFHPKEFLWMSQLDVGNVEILRFMLENGFPRPRSPVGVLLWREALRRFETFKFWLDEAQMPIDSLSPYEDCALHGNLEGLKLAFERNIPLVSSVRPPINLGYLMRGCTDKSVLQSIIDNATRSGNIEVLRFLWEKFPDKNNFSIQKCQKRAAKRSTPEILDFLTQQGAQWASEHLTTASKHKNLANLSYLTRIGCK